MAGLADAGAAVAVVGPSGDEAAAAAAVEAAGGRAAPVMASLADPAEARAAFDRAAGALGPLDLVVHALVPADAYAVTPLGETDPAAWDRRCEGVLRAGLACASAAHAHLRDRGGRFVVVVPTIALTGAAGLVPVVTALEGLRALAKSAARQWGEVGITVNCVAPPLQLVAPASAAADPAVDEPALGRAPDPRVDVAPVVALLASDAAHAVTGATIAVDGGTVMTP